MRSNRTSATACQYFDFYRVVWQLSIVNLDMQTRGESPRNYARKRRIDASNIRPIIKSRNARYHKESEQTPAEVRSSDTPTEEPCPVGYFKGMGIGSRSGKSYRSVLCDRVAASIKMNRPESTSKGFHL